ncbi:MAG: hypothetical protein ABSH29_25920 [Acidimicrobiales bacterium]|jgi:hypothetical protein
MSEDGTEDVRAGGDRANERDGHPAGERLSALAKLFETNELLEIDEISGPIHWPSLAADEAAREWPALRSWVERLIERFSHLDHHVIPRCWFLHNGHVEALAALRDQERINYGETAPGTAGVDWHRAFRDVEMRLREWTGQLACGAAHEVRTHPVRSLDSDEWDHFVNSDVTERENKAVSDAMAG